MEIRLMFELIAVYPDADIHSQFCTIAEPKISEQLKAKMEQLSGLVLPNRFVAKVCMEDGTHICIFVDEYGISFMDEPAVHWWGDETMIKAPDNTVIFFHY